MSCVSSITDDDATADSTDPGMLEHDDASSSSSDEEGPGGCPAPPPPPPPHIELLALAPDHGGGTGTGPRPLVRVVSYLDDAGRGSAARSCAVLREAADAWAGRRRAVEGRRKEEEEKERSEAPAAPRRAGPERREGGALREREGPVRPERGRTAGERRRKEQRAEREGGRNILEEMDDMEESVASLFSSRAARPPSSEEEGEGGEEKEKNKAERVLAVEPAAVERRQNLEEMDDFKEAPPELSPPRAAWPPSLHDNEDGVDSPEKGPDAPGPLAASPKSIFSDLGLVVSKRSLPRPTKLVSYDKDGDVGDDEDEAISPKRGALDAPAPLLSPPSESSLFSDDEDSADPGELPKINRLASSDEGVAFIQAYENFADSPTRTAPICDPEEGPNAELSAQPAAPSTHNMTPSTGTPEAPVSDTPSPPSLLGATKLGPGSMGHRDDRAELPIFDQMPRMEEGAQKASNALLAVDINSSEPSATGREPQNQVSAPQPRLTSLRDVLEPAANEEIPFDEIPFDEIPRLSKPTSSEKVPYETSLDSTRSIREPRTLERQEYAPDVLNQLSDAALFGETPRVFSQTPQVVTNFVSEIFDSAKEVVSHLRGDEVGRRNRIDDDGPIKIGDRYYSHNEALQKWRKAKVKLNDQYNALDEDVTICEKNSVPRGEPKGGEADAVKTRYESMQLNTENAKEEAVPIGELVARLKHLEKRTQSNQSQKTVIAGNIRSGDMTGKEEAVLIDELITRHKLLKERSMERHSITAMAGNKLRGDEEPEEPDRLERLPVVEESKEENATYSEATETDTESDMESTDSSNNLDIDGFTNRLFEDILNEAILVESRFKGITNEASHVAGVSCDTDSKDDGIHLKKSIQLTRARAKGSSDSPQTRGDKAPAPADTNSCKLCNKHETDSVAGKDSLPSHMGVEVTSIHGTTANFISGKSSEQVKIGGGKSVRKEGEQSVLGSQYGTEVVVKSKKAVAARKPRILAGHNMSVTALKQISSGHRGAAARQANTGVRGGATRQPGVGAKVSTARLGENHQRARSAERTTGGKSAPQTNSGASGNVKLGSSAAVKSSSRSKGSPPSSKQYSQGNTGTRPAPMRSASSRMKMQMKPNFPLKKLKLGIKIGGK